MIWGCTDCGFTCLSPESPVLPLGCCCCGAAGKLADSAIAGGCGAADAVFWLCPIARIPQPPIVAATEATMINIFQPGASFFCGAGLRAGVCVVGLTLLVLVISFTLSD